MFVKYMKFIKHNKIFPKKNNFNRTEMCAFYIYNNMIMPFCPVWIFGK